jgi:large subunit ribosomal protein L35
MPKMKTRRAVYKKFRVGGTGVVKHGRGNRSHNTAKRAPKRMRQLRGTVVLDKTNNKRLERLLPTGS